MPSHGPQTTPRLLNFAQALREATDQCMAKDPSVYIMGLGVPDPKGIFGTTVGLVEKYGPERVFDIPTSENGMTGIAIGSALVGQRPILTHQRIDFALLSMEQIVNQAAKWHYMFDGRGKVPLVIRMIIGRGWGQGPQHSQSLQSWFAHVPGLKVIMPATAHDMKGLFVSAIEDDNPVICLEHRWLYNLTSEVPEEIYRIPIGQARIARTGTDVTLVASSFMVIEALRAAEALEAQGISAEVVDLRSLRPLDEVTILQSVKKTGRLIAIDGAWRVCSIASEIVALATEQEFKSLKCAPRRITFPECPSPTTPALANDFYPRAIDIVECAARMFDKKQTWVPEIKTPLDIPDPTFAGPF